MAETERLRWLFPTAVRCPTCGSLGYRKGGSSSQGEIRHCLCAGCQSRFKLAAIAVEERGSDGLVRIRPLRVYHP